MKKNMRVVERIDRVVIAVFSVMLTLAIVLAPFPTLGGTALAADEDVISPTDAKYSDKLFSDSGYEFDPTLAKISLNVAEASTADPIDGDYGTQDHLLRDLLKSYGFTDYVTNEDYRQKPTETSLGVAIASKKATFDGEDYTLLVVVPRSGNYGAEWVSNMDVGASGDHHGFTEAKNKMAQAVTDYLEAHSLDLNDHVKLWLPAYSRGAAASNMYAGQLADQLSEEALKNVYGYHFGTPKGVQKPEGDDTALQDDKYGYIHNLFSKDDPVTFVAPAEWNFGRYGDETELAIDTSDFQPKRVWASKDTDGNAQLAVVDITQENDQSLGMTTLDQGQFIQQRIDALMKMCDGDRSAFAQQYQQPAQRLLGAIMSMELDEISVDSLQNLDPDLFATILLSLTYYGINETPGSETGRTSVNALAFAMSGFKSFYSESYDQLTDEQKKVYDDVMYYLAGANDQNLHGTIAEHLDKIDMDGATHLQTFLNKHLGEEDQIRDPKELKNSIKVLSYLLFDSQREMPEILVDSGILFDNLKLNQHSILTIGLANGATLLENADTLVSPHMTANQMRALNETYPVEVFPEEDERSAKPTEEADRAGARPDGSKAGFARTGDSVMPILYGMVLILAILTGAMMFVMKHRSNGKEAKKK